MGIIASQGRLHNILREKIDVEQQIEQISQKKQSLIQQSQFQGNNPGLKEQEKTMDNQMKNMETRQKALETEYESVKALIGKNTETGFKWYGGK
ncbi:MAG: hypothetical protein V2B14_03745 [bacterium]